MQLVLLGDTHGDWCKANRAIALAKKLECNAVSLGDLGDSRTYEMTMGCNDNFYLVAGNHEEYPALHRYVPHYLGDFGTLPFAENVFFVRGAYSVDWMDRTPGFDWFCEEEIGFAKAEEVLQLYSQLKPEIVLSHDCPYYMAHKLLQGKSIKDNHTSRVLTEMFKIHQPKRWYHGHHHRRLEWFYNPTTFYSLGIDEVMVIDV